MGTWWHQISNHLSPDTPKRTKTRTEDTQSSVYSTLGVCLFMTMSQLHMCRESARALEDNTTYVMQALEVKVGKYNLGLFLDPKPNLLPSFTEISGQVFEIVNELTNTNTDLLCRHKQLNLLLHNQLCDFIRTIYIMNSEK